MSKKNKNKQNNIISDYKNNNTIELKDFVSEIKEVNTNISKDIKEEETNSSSNIYVGFNTRLIFNILLLIVAILVLVYCVFMSFAITKNELIKYKINSDIDYKVCLKSNDFYDTECLDKNMVYVASLINKIKVNYNYKFNVNTESDIEFGYKVLARLVIASSNNSNIFFEKTYDITDEVKEEMNSNTDYLIDKEVVIDYTFFNSLANKFRSNYAVNTNSYLEVSLVVNEKSMKDNSYTLNNSSKATLTVPLSQQEINVTLNNQNVDENKQIVNNSKVIVKNSYYLIIAIIVIVFIIILTIHLITKISILLSNKSKYDILIEKILRGYDRIIVNIKTIPNFEGYNFIKVESFQELVDVRDNFKCPINYYVITPHQKSEFFVTNNNDVYVYIVKAVDLDGENNEKK